MSAPGQQVSLSFDHIAQQVPDVAAAVAWYLETIPDVRVLYEDESWAFIEVSGTKLAFIRAGDHPDHIGFRVSDADLERLAATYDKEIRPHRDGTRSFYIAAPGDRWIEFISYPPESRYD